MKGIDNILRIAAQLRDTQSGNLAFILAGAVAEREGLANKIESMDLQDSVIPLGYVEDLPSALHAADIYFAPSVYEGFGLAVVEAMAAGLAVVASDVGGLGDVVDDGTTGFLVDIEDHDAFASCLRRLINDEELRDSFGTAGSYRARQLFDVKSMVASYESLYGEILIASQ